VAADDGVKPQTLEALRAIREADIPFLVAITKIDKNNADVERAKLSLVEHEVYLEGFGGSVPFVPVSSKTGEGIPALLDLLLLMADLEELTGDPSLPAEGIVIESRCDPKRGISATLIVRDGSLRQGQYVVAGSASAPLRIVEDFQGNKISEATFSSPIMVVGFSETPPVGATFTTMLDKKTAHALTLEYSLAQAQQTAQAVEDEARFVVPIVLKADVVGSIDALKHELRKHEDERTGIRVIHEGVGAIAEGDVKHASGNKNAILIGFNVSIDAPAKEMAERMGIEVALFSIIYDLADWMPDAIAKRRPKVLGEKELARAKILKSFSYTKKEQTVGCRVLSGELERKGRVKLMRGEEELGRGHIISLKSGKEDTSRISEGSDCGAVIDMALETEPKYEDELVMFEWIE
jgi:translation initiation factor IF-2